MKSRETVLVLLTILVFPAFVHCLNRTSFPAGFIFGIGSSAYQYEGAAYIDGKGPNVWDIFTTIRSDKIDDHSSGSLAEDLYHRYTNDTALLKEVGFDSLRMSISWSRVLPNGKISGGINQQGVNFYNNFINALLSNGIEPLVTLLHYDLPQALEDDYGGFLSPQVVNDFRDYADFCFKTFGDRVKYWVTINEPNIFSPIGYAVGKGPPGRCSPYIDSTCGAGNSAVEPYVVLHHALLSHASVVSLYKEKYQGVQKGKIGISLLGNWVVPKYETEACYNAASRYMDFTFGWVIDPLILGHYPASMQQIVGNRLPNFTESESIMLKGSFDFIGMNYYSTYYAEDSAYISTSNLSYTTDDGVNITSEKDGIPIGQATTFSGKYIYPKGIQEILMYMKIKYNNPPIIVTENVYLIDERNVSRTLEDNLMDTLRIQSYYEHLWYLSKAIEDGADVGGYYAWSFMDDFEWDLGYTAQMGIIYVDFNDGLKRYLKNSALWFKNFLQSKSNETDIGKGSRCRRDELLIGTKNLMKLTGDW